MISALALVLPGNACAQRRLNVMLKGYDYTVMLDTLVAWSDVLATPGETWSAVKRSLDSLSIPVTTVDSAHGVLFSPGFVARRKLANHAMSWSLRCGQGMTGDNADSWKLTIAYAVFVDPSEDGRSKVGIAMIGGAENVEGAYKQPAPCNSTGLLEQEIVKRTQLRTLNPLRRHQ
jgi:hypothetical protein